MCSFLECAQVSVGIMRTGAVMCIFDTVDALVRLGPQKIGVLAKNFTR